MTISWSVSLPKQAKFHSDSSQAFLKSGRPLLLGSNLDVLLVDELELNAERELLEAKTRSYIRVQNVYARRKNS